MKTLAEPQMESTTLLFPDEAEPKRIKIEPDLAPGSPQFANEDHFFAVLLHLEIIGGVGPIVVTGESKGVRP